MTDGPHVTIQMGLAQQLNEQARAIRELRALLAEKEETIRLLLNKIVALQQQLAEFAC